MMQIRKFEPIWTHLKVILVKSVRTFTKTEKLDFAVLRSVGEKTDYQSLPDSAEIKNFKPISSPL